MVQGQVPKEKKNPQPLKAQLVNEDSCCDLLTQRWVAHQRVNIKLEQVDIPMELDTGANRHWSFCDGHQ